jgi:hypothetical protein
MKQISGSAEVTLCGKQLVPKSLLNSIPVRIIHRKTFPLTFNHYLSTHTLAKLLRPVIRGEVMEPAGNTELQAPAFAWC